LNQDEWDRLRDAIPKKKFRLLFNVLYESGLRIQELLDLQVEDITFKGKAKGKIKVKKGKGGKSRNTLLIDSVADMIHDYVKEKNLKEKDLLFTTRSRKPYKSG